LFVPLEDIIGPHLGASIPQEWPDHYQVASKPHQAKPELEPKPRRTVRPTSVDELAELLK
jgi:hypothetical protein